MMDFADCYACGTSGARVYRFAERNNLFALCAKCHIAFCRFITCHESRRELDRVCDLADTYVAAMAAPGGDVGTVEHYRVEALEARKAFHVQQMKLVNIAFDWIEAQRKEHEAK